MRVVLSTPHLNPVGGGENYLMRLAIALNKVSDLYVIRNWPSDFPLYNGFGGHFKVYNGLFQPDVFLHSSHFGAHTPIGKRNWRVSFFPNRNLRFNGFDGCLAICEYAARYCREYWDIPTHVIEPCIEPLDYRVGVKQPKIISIGHFFQEDDGHSKNQHVLLDAFKDLSGFELVLMGNANPQDEGYLSKLRNSIGNRKVRIITNCDYQVLRRELETSSHLWHANGYGRTDPAQTEHFGIVVLEALASGVVPLVHASGGAPSIAGLTWTDPGELPELTKRHTEVPKLDPKYTVKVFEERVAEWLRSI